MRIRLPYVIVGAAAFAAAHLIERFEWTWFATALSGPVPWVTNSGSAVGFTMICMALAGFFAARGSSSTGEAFTRGVNVAIGGAVGVVIGLLIVGPGTLAPIAAVIGASVVAVGSLIGAMVAGATSTKR